MLKSIKIISIIITLLKNIRIGETIMSFEIKNAATFALYVHSKFADFYRLLTNRLQRTEICILRFAGQFFMNFEVKACVRRIIFV